MSRRAFDLLLAQLGRADDAALSVEEIQAQRDALVAVLRAGPAARDVFALEVLRWLNARLYRACMRLRHPGMRPH